MSDDETEMKDLNGERKLLRDYLLGAEADETSAGATGGGDRVGAATGDAVADRLSPAGGRGAARAGRASTGARA